MNAINHLTNPHSTPATVLDLAIVELENIFPIFDDQQLQRGVNTRHYQELGVFLSSLAQNLATTTQNTRRKQIVPTIPRLSTLKARTLSAAEKIESLQQRELASGAANANGRSFLVGLSRWHIGRLQEGIEQLESQYGSFHILIRQPNRTLCESVVRAWQQREPDLDEFLLWFCRDRLRLLGPELDPYVAQVLLGLRVSNGEIVLSADLEGLTHLNDDEIGSAILRRARALKWAEKKSPPNRSGRLDPVTKAAELSPMFPATDPMPPLNSMQVAFVRKNLRAEGGRVGLSKQQSNFLTRMAFDGAKQEGNPSAWRAIRDRNRAKLLPGVRKILAFPPKPQDHFSSEI